MKTSIIKFPQNKLLFDSLAKALNDTKLLLAKTFANENEVYKQIQTFQKNNNNS